MVKIEIYETDAEQLHAVADENGITVAEVVSSLVDHMNAGCKKHESTKRAANRVRRVGRPTVQRENIPKSFIDGYSLYKKGSINISQLARFSRLSRPTVYKYIKILERKD